MIDKIVSMITSINNNKQLQRQNELSELQFLATHLSKYSDLLNHQRRLLEPLLDEISDKSREAIREIQNDVDHFSDSRDDDGFQYTRHIYYNILRHLFNAYSYEMPWQTTEHLFFYRFGRIRDLQLEYKDLKPRNKKINWKKLYKAQGCYQLESHLLFTKEFVQLLSDFFRRIPNQDQLYLSVIQKSEPVFNLLDNYKTDFQQGIDELVALKKDNELEIVKLNKHPELYYQYSAFTKKLEFFAHFYLIKAWITPNINDCYVSRIIILGLYLILLDCHKLWGQYLGI